MSRSNDRMRGKLRYIRSKLAEGKPLSHEQQEFLAAHGGDSTVDMKVEPPPPLPPSPPVIPVDDSGPLPKVDPLPPAEPTPTPTPAPVSPDDIKPEAEPQPAPPRPPVEEAKTDYIPPPKTGPTSPAPPFAVNLDPRALSLTAASVLKGHMMSVTARLGLPANELVRGVAEVTYAAFAQCLEDVLREALARDIDARKYRNTVCITIPCLNVAGELAVFAKKRAGGKAPTKATSADQPVEQARANGKSNVPNTEEPSQALSLGGWPVE